MKTYSLVRRGFFLSIFIIGTVKLFSQNSSTRSFHNFSETNGFVENKGQIHNQFHQKNNDVKYLLFANRMNVQLKKNSFSYDTYEVLQKPAGVQENSLTGEKNKESDSATYRFHRVDIQFPGANSSPQTVAEERSESYAVYYTSKNTESIKVYHYKRVLYKDIYPGIDLVFDTRNIHNEKGFEYYFLIKPGADADQIRLKYNGAKTNLRNNRIIIEVAKGKIEEKMPASFIADERPLRLMQPANKSKINVAYKECGNGLYKFTIPFYDTSKTLIIDPVPALVWGTYYGGSLNDYASCIAKDPGGNILVGGASGNVNLATTGAYQTTLMGFTDAMIGKFESNGNLLWMTYYGGEGSDDLYSICSDNNGNIFVAGSTNSKTGIATPGSYQPVHGNVNNVRDAFVAKFNAAGNRIWGTYYGGAGADYLYGIRAGANGNIFVAGETNSLNGISSPGCYQPVYAGGTAPADKGDGFIASFDNNGNRLWATYFGGALSDIFYGVALDNNGNVYATGITNSKTGIATPGAFQTTMAGGSDDAMLVKFNDTGNLLWATYYGGSGGDYSDAICCDKQNNIIIGGITSSTTDIATAGTYQPGFGGNANDGFVAKFNANGNNIWGTYYGGNGKEAVSGITSDVNNNIIITGYSLSTNNIVTGNAYQTTALTGKLNVYIAKLTANGNRTWGTYYGYGSGQGRDVTTDNAGNVFVCGVTMANDSIATCNAVQQTRGGNSDMFVAMFSETIKPEAITINITSNQDASTCPNAAVTFSAAATNAGLKPTYQWKLNNVNAGTDTSIFVTSSLKTGDKVSCTVINNSGCIYPAATSNAITVSFTPPVNPSISISSSATGNICSGTPVNFTAIPVNGGTSPSYQWKINGNNAGTNSPAFTITALADGDVVSCVLTNPFSCTAIKSAISNNMVINFAVSPSVTIASSTGNVCAGTPVTFTASAINAGNNPAYQWRVNNYIAGEGATFTTSTLSANDTVQCFLSTNDLPCNNAENVPSNKSTVLISSSPNLLIQPDNPVILSGDTVQLSVIGTPGISTYNWTPAVNINSTGISNPKVWPLNTQTYNLEVSSMQGCKTNKQITVTVFSDLKVPNAFTPNNDGINDYWGIKGLEHHSNCLVKVFDRYGELVYQSAGYSKPWNGKYKGDILPLSVYVYFIDLGNGSKPLTGTVTIIR